MSIDILSIIGDLINSLLGSKPVVPPPSPAVSAPQPIPDSTPVTLPEPSAPVVTPSSIPVKDASYVTGSAFIQTNMNITGAVREANILQEFKIGNIPEFLRNFIPITVSDGSNTITYKVMPDVLCVGSNTDYVRMPMNPHTAQAIADQYDCTLITRKMSNDIWKSAVNKLEPKPWGPPYDGDMIKTYRVGIHNTTIQNQLVAAQANPFALTSGHKKDVVLTNKLAPHNPAKRVAIYGWIQPNGQPIQGLNPVSHEDTYEDYSHGIRLVDNNVVVNGQSMRMKDVFSHPIYSKLVSDEGPLVFQSY
jgi:hypothetical protein